MTYHTKGGHIYIFRLQSPKEMPMSRATFIIG